MPSYIGNDQPYLIIFCYAQDVDVTDFGDPDEIRQLQIDVFEHLVNPTVSQMSYGLTDFSFEATDWLQLPLLDEVTFNPDGSVKDKGYFDRSGSKAKMPNIPWIDALNAAIAAGVDPEPYMGYIICMATESIPGWAKSLPAGIYWPNIWPFPVVPIILGSSKHFVTLSIDSHWGRRIHEISHGLRVGDYYAGKGVVSSGANWDIGGNANRVPLYSGYSLDRMGWYKSENIKRLEWSEADFDETFEIQAHGIEENDQVDVYHLVRIKIFQGLVYYLEVRQGPDSVPADLDTTSDDLTELGPAVAAAQANPAQQLFDLQVPYVDSPPNNGGLLITKALDAMSKQQFNQRVRTITVLANSDTGANKLLELGDMTEDPARRLTISVEDIVQTRPLRLRVRVAWREVATADPAGLFNLSIRPWDDNWQSPDIWVDSPANGIGTYDNPPDPATGDIVGSGDRPWVDQSNQFYVQFRNEGVVDANDVRVTWYLNSPPAIGDRGTWIPLNSKTYDKIPAGATIKDYVGWIPKKDKHTCLKVAVSTQTGETAVDDNSAQENIFDFDTSAESPHRPILQTVSIQNPLEVPLLVHLTGSGLPPGWEATVERGWLRLDPLGEEQIRVALFTDAGRDRPLAVYEEERKLPERVATDVRFSLHGEAYRWWGEGPNIRGFPELSRPIGGILINAHARARASIDIGLNDKAARMGRFIVHGRIIPGTSATLSLSFRDAEGRTTYGWPVSNSDGRFRHEFRTRLRRDSLPIRINASVVAHAEIADTHSPTIVIESLDRWYYE